jgi:signal peptidase II
MRIRNRYFWTIAIVSLILDIISKREIVRIFDLKSPKIVTIFGVELGKSIVRYPLNPPTIPLAPDVFHLTYLRNCGAAFSWFEGHGGGFLGVLSLLVTSGLIYLGVSKIFANTWEQLGYGAILAGAAGNGIDRLFFGGCVVDFIDVRLINFAVFNWADISINIGVVCLLIYNFKLWQLQSKRN